MSSRPPATPAHNKIQSQPTRILNPMPRWAELGGGLPPVARLGLATRGNTSLTADDVALAVERGVNYLNWCGYDDGIAQALRRKLIDRERIALAMQLDARDASAAEGELEDAFRTLGTRRIDVVTFYYVESKSEWEQITSRGGALKLLEGEKQKGRVGLIGLTTHQRKLAAECAREMKLDLLMIRYNAAHRGAEQDVFPVTERLGLPVVVYTAQRWGALRRATRDDPPGFTPPAATEWYRFALAHPAVSVVLMAPNGRQELQENLTLLDNWRAPTAAEFEVMASHGLRVRQHAGRFP
ncbi:MAG TPA: aldo/keto reductase [Terriglobia bacterium]|nr:aldo/keto reductase [Terriglobia bacterium]